MNLKLNARLIAGYLLPILGLLLIGLIGIASSRGIQVQLSQVTDETVPIIEAIEGLRAGGLRIVSSTNELAFLKSLDARDGVQQAGENQLIAEGVELYASALQTYHGLVTQFFPDKVATVESIKLAGQQLQESSIALIELVNDRAAVQELLTAKEQFEQQEQDYLKIINDALEHENEQLAERQTQVDTVVNQAQLAVGGGVLATLILTLIGSILIIRSIINPLQRLMQVVRRIDRGDYEAQVAIASNDELEQLGRSINTMSLTVKRREKELYELNKALEQYAQEHAAKLVEMKGSYLRMNEFLTMTLANLVELMERGVASREVLERVQQAQTEQSHLTQN